jgi:hypothetical protein
VPQKNNYKIKMKIGDAEVEVEGAESGVVKIMEALSESLRSTARTNLNPLPPGGTAFPNAVSTTRPVSDIRSFFEQKKPSSDIEATAVAAYYLQYLASEPQKSIDSASLQEAFRMARYPLPARTAYTLTNAKNAGYLDSSGDGEFRLNAVGYNLVEHGLGSTGESAKPTKRRKHQRNKKRKKRT